MTIETRVRSTGNQGGGGGGGSSNSGGLAGTGLYYLLTSANSAFPNSLVAVQGSNVSFAVSGTNLTINATTSSASNSGGLAGTGFYYIVGSNTPGLPSSKILAAGSSVTIATDATSFYFNAITANALNFAITSRLISTTFPLSGGGDLSADRTHVVNTAFLVTSNRLINTTSPIGGGGNLGGDLTISVGSLGSLGSANQFTRTSTSGTAWEFVNFRNGSSTTVSQGSGFIQIDANTGGAASNSAGLAGTGAFFVVSSGNAQLPNAITYASVQTGFFYLPPQTALLYPSNSGATLDAGTGYFRLLYSATTAQSGKWQWVMPQDYSGSPKLRVLFGSDSGLGVTKTVIWYADVWGYNPTTAQGFMYNDTWAAVNTVTVTLPNTYAAGQMTSTLITLTNITSWQAGNFIRLRLTQSGGTVVGNTELVAAMLEYTRA